MFYRRTVIAALAAAFCAQGGAAWAQALVETEHTATEIVAERQGFVPGETTWFAVRQKVEDGWHVFWVNPGDAGIPLALDWTLPEGFKVGAVLHPTPDYIPVGPLASYAHEGAPVFLIPVSVPEGAAAGETVDVEIAAEWQACEDVCVPEAGQFSFSLPIVAAAPPSPGRRALFAAARAALPAPAENPAEISRAGAALKLTVRNWDAPRARDVFFFPVIEGLTTPAAKQRAAVRNGVLTLRMKPGWTSDINGDAIAGVLAYRDGDGERKGVELAARIDGPLGAPKANAAANAGGVNLGLLLAMAFFGGLILNAMPCVFPIIFIKAAALSHGAEGRPGALRRDGLSYAAGVLATFLALGGLLLALRAGGEQLGWGFHLQSPLVVALSAYVLLLVGLSLAGVFTVGEGFAGAGGGLARKGGAPGAFFTGALAVVVAAPCIGPLLTAPMGAALMAPAGVGMAIFALLALGLAAPFLALTFVPAFAALLPRPGPWMSNFKQALAFPVFAAAAYFLWVFSRQTGGAALGAILAGAVLLSFAAWAFEKSKGEGAAALALRVLAALAALAALAPLARIEAADASPAPAAGAYGALPTEPYDARALAAYRAAGTPVFIDFTADWCVTCQFNKMTVLKSRAVGDAFSRTGTVFMVADWTVRDPEITAALTGFGASGVPLYVYYPASGAPRILPPALSKRAVLEALGTAR